MIIGCVCYADTPYIPEHLTNPNYDFKNRKIDCEQELKNANLLIPATIPTECMPANNTANQKQDLSETQNNNNINSNTKKFGKFLNLLLE